MALILGTDGDDTLLGVLIPNPGDTTDDVILGFGGNDVLMGLSGDDLLQGGDGNDRLNGSIGDDIVFGGDGIDGVHGNAGDDLLIGGRSDDTITGGDGDDVIIWNNGDGSDSIDGGSAVVEDRVEVNGSLSDGDDFVLEAGAASGASFSRTNLGLFELSLEGVEKVRVFGHDGDDSFIVDDLAGTGVEITNFFGGDGDDTLDASAATTRVTYSADEGDDTGMGGSGDDFLRGREGVDALSGGDGADRLVGDQGGDILFGEGGNDFFLWNNGDGSDVVDGGEGVDTQRFNLSNGGDDDATLMTSLGGVGLFERSSPTAFAVTMTDIERVVVQTQAGDDSLMIDNIEDAGIDAVNFAGNFGDDTLTVAAGTSAAITAQGGAGNDDLSGGDGADILVGNIGDDMLSGGAGADRLLGQAGTDVLTGGAARDVFVFRSGDGDDTITDYEGVDLIRFNGVTFGFADLAVSDAGLDRLIETPDGDSITLTGLAGLVLVEGDFMFA